MTQTLALAIFALVLAGGVCLLAWRVKPEPERKDLLEAIEAVDWGVPEMSDGELGYADGRQDAKENRVIHYSARMSHEEFKRSEYWQRYAEGVLAYWREEAKRD